MGENLDLSNLLLQIAAQTEVHEKYTQAFVKIIEVLEEMKQKIVTAQGADGEYFRYLLEKSVTLSEQLKNFVDISTSSHKDLERDIETYNTFANKFSDQMVLQNETIKDLTPAILKLSERLENNQDFLKKVVDNIKYLNKEVEDLVKANQGLVKANENLSQVLDEEIDKMGHVAALVESMSEHVKVIYDSHTGAKSFGRTVKIYLIAIFTFIGIVETLVQLGILHLNWGGK